MSRTTRRLTVFFCLLLSFVLQIHALEQGLQARQAASTVTPASSVSATPTTTPTPTPSSTPAASPSSASTPQSSSTTPATSNTPSTTPQSTSTPTTTQAATSAPAATPNASTTTPATTPTDSGTTDTGSHVTTVVTNVTATPTGTNTLSASPSATTTAAASSSSSLGTGPIVGLSVAGGVAVICIIAFLVWKFTRKRFSDFDDNEAIKWPELNSHSGGDSHPLPVHNTGRAGFGDTDSLQNMSRAPSALGYADSMGASSTELHPGLSADPYAVPPLPHLNPNQPYHDDPQAQGFYDPYRGPVPNTFEGVEVDRSAQGAGWGGEAIPMTAMSPTVKPGSPGPQMSYDGVQRAMSAQQASRRSPAPQSTLAYGEPALPSFSGGPVMDGRSRSPGPGVGLGGAPVMDRRSPGPQAAYDSGYGMR